MPVATLDFTATTVDKVKSGSKALTVTVKKVIFNLLYDIIFTILKPNCKFQEQAATHQDDITAESLGVLTISQLYLETSKKARTPMSSDSLRSLLKDRSGFVSPYLKYAVSTTVAQKQFSSVLAKTGSSFDYHSKLFHKLIARHGDDIGLSSKTLDWLLSDSCADHTRNQEIINQFIKGVPMNLSKNIDKQR